MSSKFPTFNECITVPKRTTKKSSLLPSFIQIGSVHENVISLSRKMKKNYSETDNNTGRKDFIIRYLNNYHLKLNKSLNVKYVRISKI